MFLTRSCRLIAAALVTAVSGLGSANAALVSVQMQGTWNVQYEYLGSGANVVPVTVPISFAATIVFDIDQVSAWYVDPGRSYITEFGAPAMSSGVANYGPNNPFGSSNPSSFTLLSRHDYSIAPAAPAPFQSYQFVNRNYVQVADQTRTQNWSYGLEFHSGNQGIALDDLKLASASDFMSMLESARDSSTRFYTSFWKYTFETPPVYGPPVTYTSGIGLNGSARIVSVSVVPEPSSVVLLVSGLALVTSRLRARSASR
ncbi:PEP-CTERM sorting domain-containing protein [Aquincola sp. J276]|uniref:PEP-CTERM sorting domain-containing protein n=1 Tax=Aquincola sp. J276 TaxID=2898432 RepID=UPI002151183E|nr:PEP-CTERM sorting domain-containing protein [Aquincola sp. J276]MCR5867731.1 PEP-CTERM sorting domain-containing protein [Aquincola sp. J276]